jgi:hypothetical protein
LATPMRFRAWQTRECLARRLLTASTSASTPPPPLRLPRLVAVFVSGVFFVMPSPWHLLVRPQLHVRLFTLGNLDSSMSTTAILCMTSSTAATRPHARLPRHRHKGLPPCLSSLQPQHPRRIGRFDWGDVSSLAFSLRLLVPLQSHRLRRSHCDCGGMLEYIGISPDMVD